MDRVRNEFSGTAYGPVIQAGTVVLAGTSRPAAVAGLPAQPVFVGRHGEVDELIAAMRPTADATPVVVHAVGGLPGVGKTALAVRAARIAEGSGWFPGGVVMIDLHGYDGPEQRVDALAALASLFGALGVAPEQIPDGLDDRARLWRTTLAERIQPTLIIADNASASAQVRPLLPGTTTHRVLITSRDRLADLDGARTLSIAPLAEADSVRMLTEIVVSGHPGDQRVHREPDAAERISSLCGGLPLAIRVVAALLVADPDRSLSELAEDLSEDRTRLGVLNYDDNLAVRTAFDLSYRNLDEEHARLFRLIGLHPGANPSIEVIAALASRDVSRTRAVVRGLARAHLVQPAAVSGCWSMHDLIRNYAAEHAERDEERLPALERMIAYYALTCDELHAVLESPPSSTILRESLVWADRELSNIVTVIGLAHEIGDRTAVVRIVLNMENYFAVRQSNSEFFAANALALTASRDLGDRGSEGELLDHVGRFYRRQGQLDEAMECHGRALVLQQQVGAREMEARALNHLGEVLREKGRLEESITTVEQALSIFQELEVPGMIGSALHNLGVAHRLLGNPGRALALHLEDLRICHGVVGDRIALARVLDVLGITYRALGLFSAAVEHHERSIEMSRKLGSARDVGRALQNLGCTYREWQRLPEALTCLEESEREFDRTHNLIGLSSVLQELGTTHRAAGDLVQAARRWEEALAILEGLPGAGPVARAEWIRAALSALPASEA